MKFLPKWNDISLWMSKELNECSSLPFFFNERSLALYYNCVIRPLRVKFVLIGWSKKTYLRSLLSEYFSILGVIKPYLALDTHQNLLWGGNIEKLRFLHYSASKRELNSYIWTLSDTIERTKENGTELMWPKISPLWRCHGNSNF